MKKQTYHCFTVRQVSLKWNFVCGIISDDTDVFALASNYFPEEAMDVTMLMKPTKSGRTVTNIMVTVRKHELVMKSLLAARLSVCDTVCHYQ